MQERSAIGHATLQVETSAATSLRPRPRPTSSEPDIAGMAPHPDLQPAAKPPPSAAAVAVNLTAGRRPGPARSGHFSGRAWTSLAAAGATVPGLEHAASPWATLLGGALGRLRAAPAIGSLGLTRRREPAGLMAVTGIEHPRRRARPRHTPSRGRCQGSACCSPTRWPSRSCSSPMTVATQFGEHRRVEAQPRRPMPPPRPWSPSCRSGLLARQRRSPARAASAIHGRVPGHRAERRR